MSDCLSDHTVIFCIWKIQISSSRPKYITFRQCKNIDVDCVIHGLIVISSDFSEFLLLQMHGLLLFFLCSEVSNVIAKHAPIKTFRVKSRHLQWVNSHLISLYKQRGNVRAKYRKCKDSADWEAYRLLRKCLQA